MSLETGKEFINNTKNRFRSRMQGKGVNITDNTPFSKYPDLIENDLKNKGWSYPTDWFPLTDKSDFTDHTIEAVLFDTEQEFSFYMAGVGTRTLTLYGSEQGGTFIMNDNTYNLNTEYTIQPGKCTFKLTKNSGAPTLSGDSSTFKLVFKTSGNLTNFYATHTDTSRITYSPLLAIRAKESGNILTNIYFGVSPYTGQTINYYRAECFYLQYCDLSMVKNLNSREYLFKDCKRLVKVELKGSFVLNNYAFWGCTSLRELTGVDFDTLYSRVSVFYQCYNYAPQSFNYIGENNYHTVNLYNKTWYLPEVETYPHKTYITCGNNNGYIYPDGGTSRIPRIVVSNATTKFPFDAFSGFCTSAPRSGDFILVLPTVEATLSTEPSTSVSQSYAFIANPYKIENGDKFKLDTPVGIYLSHNFVGGLLDISGIPLRWFLAGCSLPNGFLSRLLFDGANSNFDLVSTTTPFSIKGNLFDREAIVEVFEQLPITTSGKTINVSNNPGSSSLTEEDLIIATDKGWVVVK